MLNLIQTLPKKLRVLIITFLSVTAFALDFPSIIFLLRVCLIARKLKERLSIQYLRIFEYYESKSNYSTEKIQIHERNGIINKARHWYFL